MHALRSEHYLFKKKKQRGFTSLMIAGNQNKILMMKALVRLGANVDSQNQVYYK